MKRWLKGSPYTSEPYFSLYVFLFVLFVIGVIFGANIVGSLSFVQRQDLLFFVEQYLYSSADEQVGKAQNDLLSSITSHGKYISFLFFFGLSVVGLPIVWFLLFLKGVVIGFTVGFLVNQLSGQGLLLSITAIAPQNLFIVPAYLLVVASSMIFSVYVLQMLFLKKRSPYTIGEAISLYFKSFVIALALVIVGSLIEVYISSMAMERLL
ncbi:stage II sporulation protein M [Halalkalibacillus sediminis]|uniref:Stage II sporulation protein M n=1 Tax=Halalkalibacillus sediminis TaxID=2018042 RepID=A0A2I0QX48_9BACI|nr:stage II sporulation protein M [Halalkalibacillus sediminis]PKR78913.1 stage II sporulation protein M [Halalkalibacillus sediminis]